MALNMFSISNSAEHAGGGQPINFLNDEKISTMPTNTTEILYKAHSLKTNQ